MRRKIILGKIVRYTRRCILFKMLIVISNKLTITPLTLGGHRWMVTNILDNVNDLTMYILL